MMLTQLEITKVTGVDPMTIRDRIKEWQKADLIPEGKHLNVETNREKFIREQITIYDDYLLIALQQQQMLAAGHHFVLIKEMLKLVEDKNFTDSLSAYNTLKNFTKSLKENVTYTSDGQHIPLDQFLSEGD